MPRGRHCVSLRSPGTLPASCRPKPRVNDLSSEGTPMKRNDRLARTAAFLAVRWKTRHAGELRAARRLAAMKRLAVVMVALMCLVGGYRVIAADKAPADVRKDAIKAQKAGNSKDAYGMYAKLLADPNDDKVEVSKDLVNAVQCLRNLGREDEA